MGNTIPKELLFALDHYTSFVIIGHEEPDGDALSSQFALGSFLKRKNKNVFLVSPGPFVRPEIAAHEKKFLKHIPDRISNEETLVIILDCSTIDRISYLAQEIEGFTIAVIDHHSSGTPFGNIAYIDEHAPSVTFLIERLMNTLRETPTKEEAELLFFGLATDTGFFRHLESGSGEVFRVAGNLIDAGASPKEAHYRMYGERTFESRILLGTLLEKAESHCNGKIIIARETKEDFLRFGKIHRDSDTLYQLLFSVKSVEIVLLLRYEDTHEISVGLRSIKNIDVGAVAHDFGGGGHKKAAGFTWNRSFEEIEKSLLNVFCPLLNNH